MTSVRIKRFFLPSNEYANIDSVHKITNTQKQIVPISIKKVIYHPYIMKIFLPASIT